MILKIKMKTFTKWHDYSWMYFHNIYSLYIWCIHNMYLWIYLIYSFLMYPHKGSLISEMESFFHHNAGPWIRHLCLKYKTGKLEHILTTNIQTKEKFGIFSLSYSFPPFLESLNVLLGSIFKTFPPRLLKSLLRHTSDSSAVCALVFKSAFG